MIVLYFVDLVVCKVYNCMLPVLIIRKVIWGQLQVQPVSTEYQFSATLRAN